MTKSISKMTAITGFQGTKESLVFLRSVSACVLWICLYHAIFKGVNPHVALEIKKLPRVLLIRMCPNEMT